MTSRPGRALVNPLLWVGVLFLALVLRMGDLRPVLHLAFPEARPAVYQRATFLELFLSHLEIVAVASLAAALVGIGLAIFVSRRAGDDFRGIVNALGAVGQSFPPVAVLALAVPTVGFGPLPTVIALFLYGLLPIVENAIAGLEGVPGAVREAARGMGFSERAILFAVDLPLAAPVMLAGVRTSVTIGIGTATIGSTVGAVTLGTPIFDGLAGNNLAFIAEGAVVVAVFAILTDMLFGRLELWLRRGTG
jgi:osmoprotectant transport system permease protein